MVIVSADDHVLVCELRTGNQREDVGPGRERLLERVVTRRDESSPIANVFN